MRMRAKTMSASDNAPSRNAQKNARASTYKNLFEIHKFTSIVVD